MASLTFNQVLEALNRLSMRKRHKPLTEGEKVVLMATWEGLTYEEAAKQSGHELGYIETAASHSLRSFVATELGSGQATIGKRRLRQFLEDNAETLKRVLLNLSIHEPRSLDFLHGPIQILGGQPPKMPDFYGRQEELFELRQAVQQSKLVALEGPSGIGKSALSAKLLERIASDNNPEFDCFIWKSLQYGPLPEELVDELIKLLTPLLGSEVELPDRFQARVSLLLELLRSHRCLLVLDSMEGILQGSKSLLNPYGEHLAEYEPFFWRLAEEQHSSSLVLLSSEPLTQVVRMEREGLPATKIRLRSWKMEDSLAYLRLQGLSDEECWEDLAERYENNPLAIKEAVRQIKQFFCGSVSEFIRETLMLGAFKDTLNEKLGPSSYSTDLEREILSYLAQQMDRGVPQVPFSLLRELKHLGGSIRSTSDLMEAVDSLSGRFLVRQIDGFQGLHLTLSPLVKKYVRLDPLGAFQGLTKKPN